MNYDSVHSGPRSFPVEVSATRETRPVQTVIVVPCYNEAERLDVAAFEAFASRSDAPRILFVNDGSQDATVLLLQALKARAPQVFDVLNLDRNVGKSEAVRQGMLRALETQPGLVGFWDADLATPLEPIVDFERICRSRSDIDVVLGTRLPLLGHSIQRRRLRSWLGHGFSIAASLALGLRCRDTQCGAKLFRASPALEASLADPFASRWIFDVELLARLQQYVDLAAATFEYPLEAWRDVDGSKLKSSDFLKAAWELAVIYRRYGWRRDRDATRATVPPAAESSRAAEGESLRRAS